MEPGNSISFVVPCAHPPTETGTRSVTPESRPKRQDVWQAAVPSICISMSEPSFWVPFQSNHPHTLVGEPPPCYYLIWTGFCYNAVCLTPLPWDRAQTLQNTLLFFSSRWYKCAFTYMGYMYVFLHSTPSWAYLVHASI